MQLSVVIPVHNEADNIRGLLEECCQVLRGMLQFEIVVIDDCSSDSTPQLLRDCRAAMPELHALRHRRNAGQSMALVSGIRAARAPIIATLDGDGQNNPADILLLWKAMVAAAPHDTDLLLAGRRMQRRDTWLKRLSSRIANGVRARLLGDATPDTGCGLKMFRRALFLRLPAFDHMHRFLPALVLRAGGRVQSVPVSHRPRLNGASHYGTLDRLIAGLIDLCGVLWLQRRWRTPAGLDELS